MTQKLPTYTTACQSDFVMLTVQTGPDSEYILFHLRHFASCVAVSQMLRIAVHVPKYVSLKQLKTIRAVAAILVKHSRHAQLASKAGASRMRLRCRQEAGGEGASGPLRSSSMTGMVR